MMKSIDSISMLVSEPEYRKDPALSYSQLSRFEKNGRFDSLETLNEHIETPSLIFGSMVDAICTGGMDEFNEHFLVVDSNLDSEAAAIIKEVFNQFKDVYSDFNEIPIEYISDIAKSMGFWPADKWSAQARFNGLMKKGNILEYWEFLKSSEGKTVTNIDTFNKVLACVEALKTSESTKLFFGDEDKPEGIEIFYQLKFKTNLNGVDYRCMFDVLCVSHKDKTIRPIDLKTSYKKEWNFAKSFIEYQYSIQARLYSRILQKVISNDDYYKDFTILPYYFIVVNNNTLTPTPLVWEYEDNLTSGDLVYGKDNQIVCRDPENIGQELHEYLTNEHVVPIGINKDSVNNLNNKLKEL